LFEENGFSRTSRPNNADEMPPLRTCHRGIQGALVKVPPALACRQVVKLGIVVYAFHGVPDGEHPSMGLAPAEFALMMQYLKEKICGQGLQSVLKKSAGHSL
jgi:hypothetical protein